MSTNKKVVSTTKSVLQSLNKEVKTSEVYEVYSQLCGYKGWQVASAKEVEFSPTVQLKLKEKLLNKINEMEPSLEKLFALYLLDENGQSFHKELFNIELTPVQINESLEALADLNQSLSFYEKFLFTMVDNKMFATAIIDNKKFRAILNKIHENKKKEASLKEVTVPKKNFTQTVNLKIISKNGVFVMNQCDFSEIGYTEVFHSARKSLLIDLIDHSRLLDCPKILISLKEKGIRFINNQGEVWTGRESLFSKIKEVTIKHHKEKFVMENSTSSSRVDKPFQVESVSYRQNKDDEFFFIVNGTSPNGKIKPFEISPEFISLSDLG